MFYELQSQVPVLPGPVRTWPNLLAMSPGAFPTPFNQTKSPILYSFALIPTAFHGQTENLITIPAQSSPVISTQF